MKFWQIALVSATAAVALPAAAQMGDGMKPGGMMAAKAQSRAEVEARVKERLGKFDANRDGTVAPDEMKAYAETRRKASADARFAAMDANKDGSISRTEFDAAQASRGGMRDRMVMIPPHGGPHIMRVTPEAATPPKPGEPPKAAGAPNTRRETRMMMMGDGPGMMGWSGDGKGIVIADAVKKALERFDATDTNKDGTISPEERRAQRETRRKAWRSGAEKL